MTDHQERIVRDEDFELGLQRYVPSYMQEGLRNYYYHGVDPGHFLQKVLQNDLMGALERADINNQRNLFNYGLFLFNHMAQEAYGSKEKYDAWIRFKNPKPVCSAYSSLALGVSCRNCGHSFVSHHAPGTEGAIANGCACPVMDNAHGEGRNGKFITVPECPLHKTGYGSSPLTDRQKHVHDTIQDVNG